ncbi:MAG: glycosyltransferase [Candidatus Hodarchaeota archaeon]
MRIAFVGPLNFDRYTLFISTYFTSLAKACKELGHSTRLFSYYEMHQLPWFWTRFKNDYFVIRHRFGKIIDCPHEIVLYRDLLKRVRQFQADAVILHFVLGSYYPLLTKKLRKLDIPLLAWNGSHPSGKDPPVPENIFEAYRMTDCVLYYDPAYAPLLKENGFKRIHRLPFGIDFKVYDSVKPDPTLKEKELISFIGTIDKTRGEYLRELSSFPLGIWTYQKAELQRENLYNYYRGEATGVKQIKVMKSSSVVLNIHRKPEISGGNYRLFEIPAAGACQLVDDKPGIGEYFVPEQELLTFRDIEELRTKARYLLENPDIRIAIAQAGYNRVKMDHSIEIRAQRLIEIVKEL